MCAATHRKSASIRNITGGAFIKRVLTELNSVLEMRRRHVNIHTRGDDV